MIPAQKPEAAAKPSSAQRPDRLPPWGFLEWFTVALTVIPGVLYFPGTQKLRILVRIGMYGLSLLAWAWRRGTASWMISHPAKKILALVILYLGIMLFHPTTNSFMAGFTSILLDFAVMAPIFWAPTLVRHEAQLKRVLWILLVTNGLSAGLGMLQVYYPEKYMPAEFSEVARNTGGGIAGLTYKGADGRDIIRPPGFSDNPGAAAGAGMVACLLGLIFAATPGSLLVRALSLGFAFMGLTVIYLTWVRSALVVLAGMLVAYGGRLLLHKWKIRSVLFAFLAVGLFSFAYQRAIEIGGSQTAERFATLLEADPMTVYYKAHRGDQVEVAFTRLLDQYPFGAGLGRWGMMNFYFGDPNNLDAPALWAEVQFAAWVIDGGYLLLGLYILALLISTVYDFRLVKAAAQTDLQYWAATVLAHNIGILAFIFSWVPFSYQLGMQYWLMTAVLHGAHRVALRNADENLRPR